MRKPPRRGRQASSQIENEGFYLSLGELKYQVQGSRQLNADDIQDKRVCSPACPPAQQMLKPDEVWFGVFMQVENEDDEPLNPSGDIEIIDTQEDVFKPLGARADQPASPTARPSRSPAASSRRCPTRPAFDTANQGSLLLFKLTIDALDNRPLELKIESSTTDQTGIIDLDV